MPDKYEDGKTQYKSHNRERKYFFLSQKAKEKFDFCLKRSKFNNVL